MSNHLTRLDSKGRVSIGRYTELAPGSIYRIEKAANGVLTLTPVIQLAEED